MHLFRQGEAKLKNVGVQLEELEDLVRMTNESKK